MYNRLGAVALGAVEAQLLVQEWSSNCPRGALGLACMSDAYKCVCADVNRYKAAIAYDRLGRAIQLALVMESGSASGPGPVIEQLEAVAFVATVGVNGPLVEVGYDLTLPENAVLASLVKHPVES